ncbi:MAG: Bax inhibitor-1/YccA family protein [Tenericutes bacterium]|nr:Bax inhibitor-1/YccA family protein [Mycoplasmatota bacterium]
MNLSRERGMSNFLSKVFLWMMIGLLISGGTAYLTYATPSITKFVYQFYTLILLVELIVVISFTALRRKVSPSMAKLLFIIYSIVSGLTLSSIFIVYKLGSIGIVFLAAALMFGLMGIYGLTTKNDLSSFGKILIFALIAIIIMSVINIFVQNSEFNIFICVVSILIFLGLTAWDLNNLKAIYRYYESNEEELNKAAIYGALDLYLDFINIFLNLLNLFGKRND